MGIRMSVVTAEMMPNPPVANFASFFCGGEGPSKMSANQTAVGRLCTRTNPGSIEHCVGRLD
jgi:hypothetical protein